MRFFQTPPHFAALIFLLLALLPAGVHADTNRPLTDAKGRQPRVTRVELPQEALKAWQLHNVKGKSLLLFSSDPAITPLDGRTEALVNKGVPGGVWDGLLAKGYNTPAYYPVKSFNYVYAAHKAGMISKVYWVPPTKESVGKEPLEKFKEYLKSMGASGPELDALVQKKNSIEGSVNGIPFYISDLKHLPRPKEEVVVQFDLSFFTGLYENEVKTPMLEFFGSFMNALAASGVRASDAVISYSNAGGLVPLEYRFVGDYLYTWLTKPGRLKDGPPISWYLRSQAMYYETFYQLEDVLQSYSDAIKSDPDDASLKYSFSAAFFSAKDYDKFKTELDSAVKLDPGYAPAYTTYAQYFLSKDMPAAAEPLLDAALKATPDDLSTWETFYNLCMKKKEYTRAAEAAQKIIDMGFNGPKPLSMQGDALQKAGSYDKAVAAYLKALPMVTDSDAALRYDILMGLARTYEADRKIKEAISTYGEAYNAAKDENAKQEIVEQVRSLREKWAPFLTPVP